MVILWGWVFLMSEVPLYKTARIPCPAEYGPETEVKAARPHVRMSERTKPSNSTELSSALALELAIEGGEAGQLEDGVEWLLGDLRAPAHREPFRQ